MQMLVCYKLGIIGLCHDRSCVNRDAPKNLYKFLVRRFGFVVAPNILLSHDNSCRCGISSWDLFVELL